MAIFSTTDFDAVTDVDKASLTLGRTGNEEGQRFCKKHGKDVNGDGLKDLVCIFRAKFTDLRMGDIKAHLKGKTTDGIPIKGSDEVVVIGRGN